MSIRAIFALVVLSVVALFVVGAVAKAQSFPVIPLPQPSVVSGADLGFRIEGHQNGTAVGTLVVRVNGKWIDAREGLVNGVPRITSR